MSKSTNTNGMNEHAVTLSEELTSLVTEELGYMPFMANCDDVFAVIYKTDFAGIVPNKNIAGLDDLSDYIADIVSHDGAGWTEPRVLAKHLADGIWARIRSFEYSSQTKANVAIAAASREAGRKRTIYDDMITKNPKILEDTEMLLGLQRDYGIIDLQTYKVLFNNHLKLQAAIAAAQEQAKAQVIASMASEQTA